MSKAFPQSVLFCCDHNAVRSPMAEAMMKALHGQRAYVQSAGVYNDLEIDGFAIAVCAEIGLELSRHRSRSFEEMEAGGDDLAGYDLIIALSPISQRHALELTRFAHVDIEFWPIPDPTGQGENREAKLGAYREVRDEILRRLEARFGPKSV